MHAKDVMTREVVAVAPDAPVPEIARLLLQHGISAVPVVDGDKTPIGMVSEGDLATRSEMERLARRDWWLNLLASEAPPDETLLEKLRSPKRTASDVMSAPVLTVSEDTSLSDVARLLEEYHVKRLPVVADGKLVGLVSRADLLKVVADSEAVPAPQPRKRGFLLDLFGPYHRPGWQVVPIHPAAEPAPSSRATGLSADTFRALVQDHQRDEAHHRDEARRAAAKLRREQARTLIDTHVFDGGWRDMLHRAREAAESGASTWQLLRFPTQLCLDGGRAINNALPGWPKTLRGEPAEIYLRWERTLKPVGFHLSARIVAFSDGKPGDAGLFLGWGD